MDTVHWPQEEMISQNTKNNPCSKTLSNSSSLERRSRPQKDSAVNCPRCNSTNTKFCYYNNYSLSQPRYFCKTCRRYWTEGGTLRNVPVGGGSRKNKRSSSSSSSSSVSSSYSSYNSSSNMSKKLPDLVVPHASTPVLSQNPRMHHEHGGQDLNLGFPSSNDFKTISELIQAPNFDNHGINTKNTNLELLNGITTTTRGSMMMNSFMPMPIPIPDSNSVYSSSGDDQLMIPMPEFKIPSLNFSLDGSYGIGHENSSGRLLFPFEDLKTSTISTTTTTTTNTNDHEHHNAEHNRDQNGDTNGFWSGMLGGAGSCEEIEDNQENI